MERKGVRSEAFLKQNFISASHQENQTLWAWRREEAKGTDDSVLVSLLYLRQPKTLFDHCWTCLWVLKYKFQPLFRSFYYSCFIMSLSNKGCLKIWKQKKVNSFCSSFLLAFRNYPNSERSEGRHTIYRQCIHHRDTSVLCVETEYDLSEIP